MILSQKIIKEIIGCPQNKANIARITP